MKLTIVASLSGPTPRPAEPTEKAAANEPIEAIVLDGFVRVEVVRNDRRESQERALSCRLACVDMNLPLATLAVR